MADSAEAHTPDSRGSQEPPSAGAANTYSLRRAPAGPSPPRDEGQELRAEDLPPPKTQVYLIMRTLSEGPRLQEANVGLEQWVGGVLLAEERVRDGLDEAGERVLKAWATAVLLDPRMWDEGGGAIDAAKSKAMEQTSRRSSFRRVPEEDEPETHVKAVIHHELSPDHLLRDSKDDETSTC
jgi:hypothetical protein